VERQHPEPRSRHRDPRRVVRVAGVREDDGRPALGEREAELDDRGLRAGHDGDLALGVELDAVLRRVARGDRLAQTAQAAKGRVAVRPWIASGLRERLDDVGWGADLGIPAAQIEERLALFGPRRRNAR
jgi:hypothetical protein